MADTEFDVQAKHVERRLTELRSSISAFSKLSSKLTGEDSVMKRSIRSASHEIQSAAHSIEADANALTYIERHPRAQIQGQRRLRQHRLLRDLNALRKQFKTISETVKMNEHREALKEGDRCNELQGLLDQQCDEIILIEEGIEIERGLEQERSKELSMINKKVSMVQEAFQNFADIATEQGELLDDMESCVVSTRNDTEKAAKDLKEIAAARSCNVVYFVLAVIAAFIIYLIAI